MIPRDALLKRIKDALRRSSGVVLFGPRQRGKTTLAWTNGDETMSDTGETPVNHRRRSSLLAACAMQLALAACAGPESDPDRPYLVSGQLVDQDGHPIAWTSPAYHLQSARRIINSQLECDGQGHFEIRRQGPIEPGSLHIILLGDYGGAEKTFPLGIDEPSAQVDLGRLTIPLPPVLAAGRVLDERGEPVPFVMVEAFPEGEEGSRRIGIAYDDSDPQGLFEIRGALPRDAAERRIVLKPRPGKVEAVSLPRATMGTDGARSVTLRVLRLGNLKGILDHAIVEGSIDRKLVAEGERRSVAETVDERGRFEIRGLPFGAYRLRFEARTAGGKTVARDLGVLHIQQRFTEWP